MSLYPTYIPTNSDIDVLIPDNEIPHLLESCKEKGHQIEAMVCEHFGDNCSDDEAYGRGVWYIIEFCETCGKCEGVRISEERFLDYAYEWHKLEPSPITVHLEGKLDAET